MSRLFGTNRNIHLPKLILFQGTISIMQVIDSYEYSFRDRLVEIIDDQEMRNSLRQLKENDKFIENLVKSYIDEFAQSYENKAILKRRREKLRDVGASAKSLVDCVDFAYILFLTRSFSDPDSHEWAKAWIAKVHEHYPGSTLLRFLDARVKLPSSHTAGYEVIENEACIEKQAIDDLKFVLKTDHESVIDAMHRLNSIMLYTFANHKNILDWHYAKFSKRLFPEASKDSFPNAVSSYYHAICADYYRIVGMKKEQKEESYKAFELYSDNSLAVVQIAYTTYITYITTKEGNKEDRKNAENYRKKAKKMFEDSLRLAKNQFCGFPITRISIEATAHAGLGYLYSRSGQYRKAERCYRDAISKIELSQESRSPSLQSMKSFILLNRGRSRLDNGKFEESKKDFDEASKDPDLLPFVETNLGILCYKQSFNGKAKSKFNHAIELKSDLAEAYYNLGVIYNEEGRKEKAIRLFNTALEIDEDLTEAYNALEKLEGPKVQDIRDWYNWWFGRETSRYKKGLGTVFVGLILLGITWTIYDIHMTDSAVSTAIFGVLGFALIFLVLPLITKLKLGTVEVEMESKGERPLSYANGPSLKSA